MVSRVFSFDPMLGRSSGWRTLLQPPRLVALAAALVSLPPIFAHFGRTDGLSLSLSLLLFYLGRGILTLTSQLSGKDSNLRLLTQAGRIFHFGELPLLLSAVYAGILYLPDWIFVPYERVLMGMSPLLIVAEGLAAMQIILTAGQTWIELLADSSQATKMLVAGLCLAAYAGAIGVTVALYVGGQIATILSASLVATVLTLIAVLTVATVLVGYGIITDPSLIFLYATYNLWVICRLTGAMNVTYNSGLVSEIIQLESTTPRTLAHTLWEFLQHFLAYWNVAIKEEGYKQLLPDYYSTPSAVASLIASLLSLLSIELVACLLVQMSLFLLALRLLHQSSPLDLVIEGIPDRQWSLAEILLDLVWPHFGQCLMIMIYTHSWLIHAHPAIPWWVDPVVWRWINIFMCLFIYTRHLMIPPGE